MWPTGVEGMVGQKFDVRVRLEGTGDEVGTREQNNLWKGILIEAFSTIIDIC